MRKRNLLVAMLAAALAACGTHPAAIAPPPSTLNGPSNPSGAAGIPADGELYPTDNHYRVLATEELPIVGVTVDSAASGYPASNLTDGNLSTQWANGGYKDATAWAAVQLSAPASLGSIGIKTAPSPAGTSYDVQVSNDGNTWNTALSNQTNTTWNLETKTLPAGTTGTYVRILWHNSASNPQPHFSIFELEINGTPGTGPSPTPTPSVMPSPTPTPTTMPSPTPSPVNSPTPTPMPSTTATPGGPVTQLTAASVTADSTYNGLSPQNAVDGNLSTQWANGGYKNAEAWLALQFDQTYAFDHLAIKTGALPAGVSYRVEVSNDGTTWTAASGQLTNTTWNMETKSVSGSGKYLRLHFFNNPSNPIARFSVFEVQVYGAASNGSPVPTPTPSPAIPIAVDPGYQNGLQLALDPVTGRSLAVFTTSTGSGGDYDVYAQLLGTDGVPVASPLDLTPKTGDQDAAQVLYNPDAKEFLVVYHDPNAYGAGSAYLDVVAQRVSTDGTAIGSPLVLTPNTAYTNQEMPTVAYNGATHEYLVVWQDDRDYYSAKYALWGQRLSTNFTLVGANFPISTTASTKSYTQLACSSNSDDFLLVWSDDTSGNYNLHGRMLDSTGAPVGNEFALDPIGATQTLPTIAFDWKSNQFLVAWSDEREGNGNFDLFGERFTGGGSPIGSAYPLVYDPYIENAPVAAYDGKSDRYLIAYEDYLPTGDSSKPVSWDIEGLSLDGNGNPIQSFPIQHEVIDEREPSVMFRYSDDQFLVGWQRWVSSSDDDLYGRWVP